ncbi:MAG: FAD-dependent oxidoreductase, partial [Acidobacteria bacterium]|nr:FAD-dependent oxidoreductase [Acidobacteriota bacterium]
MHRRVAIIGGGLSGLTCAHALNRRGIPSVVFEASATPGGRSTVEQIDGFTVDAGAQYLLNADLFRNSFELIRKVGLSNDLIAIPPSTGQCYKGRIYRHRVASATGLLKFKGLRISDKVMLPRMAFIVNRLDSAIHFHRPERGIAHDDETVAAFVKRELSQNVLNYVAGPLISTLFLYSSTETSKLLFLMLAKHMQDTQMSTIRGGIGRLTSTLAASAQIRICTKVEQIGVDHKKYTVGGETFSDVVVATTGDSVLAIDGIAGMLSEEDREFFDSCKYERAVTAMVATARAVDGACYGVSIPRVEKLSAATISFHDYIDPSRVPEGHGLLAISGGGQNVSATSLISDLHRLYRIEPLWTKSYEWRSAMPKFPPGRYREIAAFQARQR